MATPMEEALSYAQRGWLVIPLHYPIAKGKCSCGNPECENVAKHPMMTKHGLKDATKDQKQIKEWWGKTPQANIGIVTGPGSGLVVLDIDPRNGGNESMKAITKLGNIPVTPMVFTGGGGEHIYFMHPGNGTKIKSTKQVGGYAGVDIKGDGGYVVAPPSRHMSGSRYTWKRNHLANKIAPIPQWMTENLLSVSSRDAAPNNNAFSSSRGGMGGEVVYPPNFCDAKGFLAFPEGTRDESLFEIAATLKRGGMLPGKVRQIIATIGEKACEPSFSVNESYKKVDSAFSEERNYSAEIRALIRHEKSHIDVTYIDKELQYDTPRHKASRRMVIHRLIEEKALERTPKAGVYRILADSSGWMNLADEGDADFMPLKWPFGLENLVDIPPKGIVVVAGTKDAGKTVFALNAVAKNMNQMPTYYFSSEMGEFALKKRLKNFEWPLDTWKFKAKEWTANFADVIVPDAFNVVDYLEITDKFWLVAEEIRQIFDKLTTGVAMICLQKAPGAELARGQGFSIEKAHMYLSLEVGKKGQPETLTIISGKFWHQEGVNPRGQIIKYKIWNGYKLIEQ